MAVSEAVLCKQNHACICICKAVYGQTHRSIESNAKQNACKGWITAKANLRKRSHEKRQERQQRRRPVIVQIVVHCMQLAIVASFNKPRDRDLLCVPKRGNTPPKVDRVKPFAARALAAQSGYASTRNVKIPEYTRMVLSWISNYPEELKKRQDIPPSEERATNNRNNPMDRGIYRPCKNEQADCNKRTAGNRQF